MQAGITFSYTTFLKSCGLLITSQSSSVNQSHTLGDPETSLSQPILTVIL